MQYKQVKIAQPSRPREHLKAGGRQIPPGGKGWHVQLGDDIPRCVPWAWNIVHIDPADIQMV